ncbi:MAG: AAA family ATPase [Acidobacteria bacterium]|nr:AAA family ATPase [Acidobacteriota bacterium]
MEITRVIIENFRSIKQADIVLGHTTVFIGPNNVGKTAILDAVRIALSRRWGRSGTGFLETDIYLPGGITDPKQADPITIHIEFQERTLNEWTADLQNALDDVIQIEPVSGRSFIILKVTCGFNDTGTLEPRWEFLNMDRQALTGKGARSTNLQEFFQYLPVFYLKPSRDADEEFSARSQFWGRLLKAMNVPEALQATLRTSLDNLNKQLLTADPRLDTVATDLKNIAKVAPAETPGDLTLRAVALQPWDMLQKTEVIYKSHQDQPWLPLTSHGHGVQSLAVIFLFNAYVKLLLAEAYRPDSTAILELEEPETHLHPQATRSLCSTILNISGQKLLTTHSPYFVQRVPFRDLRLLRMTKTGTTISWLPPNYSTTIPASPALSQLLQQHADLLTHDASTSTLTTKGVIPEDLYRRLLTAYANHAEVKKIVANLKALKEQAEHHIADDELAQLETWARRIRGEIFFARKWLIVEGQSDYLIMHTIGALMGYPLDEHGISVIDAQNNGNPGTFAALARALAIPWIAMFDGDSAGQSYVAQIKKRNFEAKVIAEQCIVIPATDLEELLVTNGLEQELRTILKRLGVQNPQTIPTPDVISELRANKIEYATELATDLQADPTLFAKTPAILKETITRLQAVQA